MDLPGDLYSMEDFHLWIQALLGESCVWSGLITLEECMVNAAVTLSIANSHFDDSRACVSYHRTCVYTYTHTHTHSMRYYCRYISKTLCAHTHSYMYPCIQVHLTQGMKGRVSGKCWSIKFSWRSQIGVHSRSMTSCTGAGSGSSYVFNPLLCEF